MLTKLKLIATLKTIIVSLIKFSFAFINVDTTMIANKTALGLIN